MKPTVKNLKHLFHQSNLIEGYDDPEFDAQSMVAWNYIVEVDPKSLSHGDICKVQKIITLRQTDLQPDWRGYYRKIDVWIGGAKATPPREVPMRMDLWLAGRGMVSPEMAHVDFEKIHPFVDGNGRTGRMLMWWDQLKRGEPLTEILFENRIDYYRWFQ